MRITPHIRCRNIGPMGPGIIEQLWIDDAARKGEWRVVPLIPWDVDAPMTVENYDASTFAPFPLPVHNPPA